jgi:hypothetical protein
MADAKNTQTYGNDSETSRSIDADLTRARSPTVHGDRVTNDLDIQKARSGTSTGQRHQSKSDMLHEKNVRR